MFKITHKKGFHITFENQWTVSVQFGPGNYCDNYDRRIGQEDEQVAAEGSSNAECAVWGPTGKMVEPAGFGWSDCVSNRSSPEEVLKLLNWAASQISP